MSERERTGRDRVPVVLCFPGQESWLIDDQSRCSRLDDLSGGRRRVHSYMRHLSRKPDGVPRVDYRRSASLARQRSTKPLLELLK